MFVAQVAAWAEGAAQGLVLELELHRSSRPRVASEIAQVVWWWTGTSEELEADTKRTAVLRAVEQLVGWAATVAKLGHLTGGESQARARLWCESQATKVSGQGSGANCCSAAAGGGLDPGGFAAGAGRHPAGQEGVGTWCSVGDLRSVGS